MKKLIAGNWKMNGSLEQARALGLAVSDGVSANSELQAVCDFAVFPPFLHLAAVEEILKKSDVVALGAQDCSVYEKGARTGDVSAAMLSDFSCAYVLAGHSERRQGHGESNAIVRSKAEQIIQGGMVAVICVGETLEEREAGKAETVVRTQLVESLPDSGTAVNCVIAYEPVWAIGTGKVAGTDDIAAIHALIRRTLEEKLADAGNMRILYGGSVKPENATEILDVPNVDGALVGGASLNADDFLKIGQAVKSL